MLPSLLSLMLAFQLLQAFVPNVVVPSALGQQILSGRLDGDPELEGGCDWLDALGPLLDEEASRFEPLWPQGYSVAFNPVRLHGPDGQVVAQEGDVVTVAGRTRPDVVTICQVGPVFEVQRILAVNGRPV
ncbi:MAG: hypothetical protein ABR592_02070 [Nitriliruptorales bacterium]